MMRQCGGYSLIELMICVTIVLALAAIAAPTFAAYTDRAKVARAIGDITTMAVAIDAYKIDSDGLPTSLAEVGYATRRDPWGNPYQYLKLQDVKGLGGARKDRFLVPLNSDYDLYSMGKDRGSQPPLTAKASRDDIVRANNGSYVGLASSY